LFRIDKSSVSYKKDVQPFVLAHAAMMRPAPLSVASSSGHLTGLSGAEAFPVAQGQEEAATAEITPEELMENARMEADAIIAAAEEKAAALVARATLDTEEARKKALEEANEIGHSQGYAKGRGEGISAYNAAILDAQKLLGSAAARLEAERAALLGEAERQCVALSVDVAQKVVGMSLAMDENAFPTLIRRALDEIQHDGRILVRVSPLEYAIFFSEGSGWLSDETRVVTAVPDELLQEGDLKLESDIESLNAGVRAQMESIRKALAQLGGGR